MKWKPDTNTLIFAVFLAILMSNHAVAIRSPSIGSSNRLLEAQLKMLAREQEKIGNRLISASIQEIQIHVNKLPITTNFQTTIINSLANKGLSDLNNIGRSLSSQSIQQCYEQNNFPFSSAISIAKSQALECVNDKFNEVSGIVDRGKSNIQNALTNVQDVNQLLGQCAQLSTLYPSFAGFVAKGACLNTALLSIQTDTLLLPINVAKRVLEVRDSINSIQADITNCGLKIIQAITKQSIEAVRAIAKCISQQGATVVGSGS